MAESPTESEKPPGPTERFRKWARYVADALLASFVMLILGLLGYLTWLERGTIELAAAVSASMPRVSVRSAHESTAAYESSVPRVVVITEAEFQGPFSERSPLDRGRLLELLRALRSASPALLAIDIDLSPVAGASEPEANAQRDLDDLLLATAQAIPLVLVAPYPSSVDARIRMNAAWMAKLCAHPNIEFAYPYVARNQGVVTKLHPSFPSLGNVAYAAWQRVAPDADIASRSAAGSPPAERASGASGVCAALDRPDEATPPVFLDSLFVEHVTRSLRADGALVPLNINYFEEGLAERFRFAATELASDALAGKVVFLGGEWNPADRFVTASGDVPGVMVHSATFFTRTYPMRNLPRSLLFLIQTLLGVLLLRAFVPLWERYFARLIVPPAQTRWRTQLRAFVAALPWAAAVVLIAGLVVFGSVVASGFLLAQATWFNFGPIAIAAALKARATGGEVEVRRLKARIAELEQTSTRGTKWVGLADWLVARALAYRWLLFFAVAALGVLMLR